mmetsp:Transcript_4202/g.8552  ORF Transcript_4202/g.8552 Transcript_4202/m.8552 type:complete len:104 (-) Transcript_4202:107-418(-)
MFLSLPISGLNCASLQDTRRTDRKFASLAMDCVGFVDCSSIGSLDWISFEGELKKEGERISGGGSHQLQKGKRGRNRGPECKQELRSSFKASIVCTNLFSFYF